MYVAPPFSLSSVAAWLRIGEDIIRLGYSENRVDE